MKLYRMRLVALALAVPIALAGCSSGARPSAAPPPTQSSASEAGAALNLLLAGDDKNARRFLKRMLKRNPGDQSALMLMASIEGDPQTLLGPQHYSYTVRRGDTFDSLAQRHLGTRLKAYLLARYNNLAGAMPLVPGQVIRMPGVPPAPPRERIVSSPPMRRPEATPPSRPPRTVQSVSAANIAAARQARTIGLGALQQGRIAQAVMLLRRAASLDTANPQIKRDLARAERIARSLAGK